MKRVLASELRLGDVVKLSDHDEAWMTAIVKQVKDDTVTFFRPYGTTSDFACTSGVICYIGVEEFSRPITDKAQYTLLRHTLLKDHEGQPLK